MPPCSTCNPVGKTWTAIAMGAFDQPTGTKPGSHVRVVDKGDYHEIADGLPQNRH